jgi:hypothetical protein
MSEKNLNRFFYFRNGMILIFVKKKKYNFKIVFFEKKLNFLNYY